MPDLDDLNDQLITASHQGDSDKVTALISQIGPTLNGSLALRAAAEQGKTECVRLLIPVSEPQENHSFALRGAASNGHAGCVALLLPVSDPFALSDDGLTASDEARAHGHPRIAGMIDAFIEDQALSKSLPARHAWPPARATL